MTTHLLPELPNELLEHILELLHDERDLLSLKACSLTCRHIAVWSQRLLFRRIKLQAHFQHNAIPTHYFLPIPAGFIFLLRKSPHLAKHVQRFELEIRLTSRPTRRQAGDTSRNVAGTAVPDPPSEEDAPLVQDLFIGLNEFRLTSINDSKWAVTVPWYLSGSGLIKTLGRALAVTTSLKVLDVTGVPDFPLSILKGSNISSLWVSRVVEEEDYTSDEVVAPGNTATLLTSQREVLRCAPSFLHLGGTSSIYTIELLKSTHGAVKLDNLTELSIESSDDPLNTRGLTGSDWPQVTSLHLRARDCRLLTSQIPLLRVASFKALHTINLHSPIPHLSCLEEVLFRLIRLLHGATLSRETLTKVVMELVFNSFTESMDSTILSNVNWAFLKELRGRFQKLQHVTICFHKLPAVLLFKNKSLRRLLEDNLWISKFC